MGKHSESKKNSLKPNTASHNASWCTDTDRFLEHSSSRTSLLYKITLHKIILVLAGYSGSPLYIHGLGNRQRDQSSATPQVAEMS